MEWVTLSGRAGCRRTSEVSVCSQRCAAGAREGLQTSASSLHLLGLEALVAFHTFFHFFKEDSAIFSYKGKPGSSGSVADSLQRDRPRLHESRQHFPRSKPALAGTSRLGQAAGAGAPARPSPPSLLYREGEQAAPGDDCPAQRTRVSFAGGRGEAEGGAGTPRVVCTMAEKKRRAPPAAGAASSSSLPAEDCPAQLSPAVSPWLPP